MLRRHRYSPCKVNAVGHLLLLHTHTHAPLPPHTHSEPWVITVAAGTHDRQYNANGSLTAASGGASLAVSGSGWLAPAVASTGVYYGGQDPDAAGCFADSLPAEAAGKIVLCDRGLIGRVQVRQGLPGCVLAGASLQQAYLVRLLSHLTTYSTMLVLRLRGSACGRGADSHRDQFANAAIFFKPRRRAST